MVNVMSEQRVEKMFFLTTFAASLSLFGASDPSLTAAAQGRQLVPRPGEARVTEPVSSYNAEQNLPFARGKTFADLDAYLAYLERKGAYDTPFWRLTRSGEYQLISRRGPGQAPVTATRGELLKRYGFKH